MGLLNEAIAKTEKKCTDGDMVSDFHFDALNWSVRVFLGVLCDLIDRKLDKIASQQAAPVDESCYVCGAKDGELHKAYCSAGHGVFYHVSQVSE